MSTKQAKICEVCGQGTRNAESNFCQNCGEIQNNPNSNFVKVCPSCGSKEKKSAIFCCHCGKHFDQKNLKQLITYLKGKVSIMFKTLTASIAFIALSIIVLVFSIILFPIFMGMWAIFFVIGAALVLFGGIFSIIFIKRPTSKTWVKTTSNTACIAGLVLIFGTLLVWGSISLAQSFADQKSSNSSLTNNSTIEQKNSTDESSDSVVEATTTPDNSSNIAPVVNNGINVGSKEKYLVEAGDCVVGDIAVVNTDGTREALYDNDAGTALVTVFQQNTWIYAEWGCFVSKQASQSEIDQLVADKQQSVENYNGVIFTTWPSK